MSNVLDPIRSCFTAEEFSSLQNEFYFVDDEKRVLKQAEGGDTLDATELLALWTQIAVPLSSYYTLQLATPNNFRENLEKSSFTAEGSDTSVPLYSTNDQPATNELRLAVRAGWRSMYLAVVRGVLQNSKTSEQDYKDKIVHLLFEPLFEEKAYTFLDYQRGEIENVQRRDHRQHFRENGNRRLPGYNHDGMINLRVGGRWFHVFFLEVVGGPGLHDDAKREDDITKLFKAMQLSLFWLRKELLEKGAAPNSLTYLESHSALVYETTITFFRMHRADSGLYLVDKVFEHAFPQTLEELPCCPIILEFCYLDLKSRLHDMYRKIETSVADLTKQGLSRLARQELLRKRRSPLGEHIAPSPSKKLR